MSNFEDELKLLNEMSEDIRRKPESFREPVEDDFDGDDDSENPELSSVVRAAKEQSLNIANNEGGVVAISIYNLVKDLERSFPGLLKVSDELQDQEICHIAERVCPRSSSCVSWVNGEDDEDGFCSEIEAKNSERTRNEAISDLAGRLIDVVDDLRSGDPKSSPVSSLIGRFAAMMDLGLELLSPHIAKKKVASESSEDKSIDV